MSVRRRLSAEGEPAEFGDVVGELTGWSGGVLTITRRDGSIAHVAEDTLVAGKVVPPVPVRGPAAVPDEALERANDRAWPALEYAPLGDWWLRAASGFTRRANSVLPLGDPGVPFDDAVAGARAWYAERGLPTYVQTVVGSPVDDRLAAAGWAADGLTSVQTAPLAAVRDRIGDTSAWADRVEVSDLPDTAWLSRYKRVT
ncbi:MAG: GNAT family N-acetyltransferase, partial [Streptomycetaceae bacterium]|nr:GNAT family N-acetyltransferase [Streptomycetaceae bacterium]